MKDLADLADLSVLADWCPTMTVDNQITKVMKQQDKLQNFLISK